MTVISGPLGAPKYDQEPKPSRWSPWRRWLRYALLISPLVLGLGSMVVLVLVVATGSLGSTPAFAGAIVGALIATFGNLLVQYLLALIQSRRAESDRIRREIGITTLLMAELGEALVRMRANSVLMRVGNDAALRKLGVAGTDTWDEVKLDAAQLWMPASIFTVQETYSAIRITNIEIEGRTDRIHAPDFIQAVDGLVQKIGRTVKMLERRQLRAGRE